MPQPGWILLDCNAPCCVHTGVVDTCCCPTRLLPEVLYLTFALDGPLPEECDACRYAAPLTLYYTGMTVDGLGNVTHTWLGNKFEHCEGLPVDEITLECFEPFDSEDCYWSLTHAGDDNCGPCIGTAGPPAACPPFVFECDLTVSGPHLVVTVTE